MTTSTRPGARAALRQRDFALLWSGQSVSLVGDGFFTVALAVETLRLDPRPGGIAFVIAARLAPTVLLLLLGGALVDRMPRRVAMLVSDGTRAAIVLGIAALTALGRASIPELVAMAVVFGTADALFYPASTAIVPEILPAELLSRGSGLNTTSRVAAQMLIGPTLGGALVSAYGAAPAFALDGLSFLVSATCIVLMTRRPRPPASGRSMLADVGEGLRYCRSQRWLWVTIVAAGIANCVAFSPAAVTVPLLVRGVLHASPLALGFVFAAEGVGGAVASLAVTVLGAPRRRMTAMWLAWCGAAVAVTGAALSPQLAIVAAFAAVAMAGLMYGNVLWDPLMQEHVPAAMIGRASSVDWLVSLSLSPLGVILAGLVAGAVGVRATMAGGGVVAALCAAGLLIPGVRDPDRRVRAAG